MSFTSLLSHHRCDPDLPGSLRAQHSHALCLLHQELHSLQRLLRMRLVQVVTRDLVLVAKCLLEPELLLRLAIGEGRVRSRGHRRHQVELLLLMSGIFCERRRLKSAELLRQGHLS